MDYEENPHLNIPSDVEFVMKRTERGAETNVPWLVEHHSPTGFEWGYGGSGPADLALNILESVLRRIGYKGPKTDCYDGRCFELAWNLHQEFKWYFVSRIDREGGSIPVEKIEAWLHVQMAANDAAEGVQDAIQTRR